MLTQVRTARVNVSSRSTARTPDTLIFELGRRIDQHLEAQVAACENTLGMELNRGDGERGVLNAHNDSIGRTRRHMQA
eukprot:scaffold14607_cov123-Isochrysis_galbana.AAC.1